MRTGLRGKIIDYGENHEQIEHWIEVKGEEKYNRFAEILAEKEIAVTWVNISHLFRYDKRLLVNNFRYFSFLEEYYRAIVIESSNNPTKKYEDVQEMTFGKLIEELLAINQPKLEKVLGMVNPKEPLDRLRKLRNQIAHNKIMLDLKDLEKAISDVRKLLPLTYKESYTRDMKRCVNGLNINEKLLISSVPNY